MTEMPYLFVFTQFPAKAFHVLPGKTARHFCWNCSKAKSPHGADRRHPHARAASSVQGHE
ncbi:hypothetical protein GFL84_06575 [Rhizobium leguminosarum bv. viciae]|nr:hypothetical protein [Rhizobium leguminosarum bv. viciae]NKM77005.1 hypothetical protein [Rhizobium leguminosarum bv. viciae]